MTASPPDPLPYAEVIGDPIAQSKSPLIHRFWLKQLGIAADYRHAHITAAQLGDYLAQRRCDPAWRGCNVTLPHKRAVTALVDGYADSAAAQIGALNTLVRQSDGQLIGANSDSDGVLAAIAPIVPLDPGARVVLIGSGGAARAALAALAGLGVTKVQILSRQPEAATLACNGFSLTGQGVALTDAHDALTAAQLLINASPMGMTGQAAMANAVLTSLPAMAPDALVFDMVYAPRETPLLHSAARAGLRTAGGLSMLIGQAASAFERFFGAPPPRDQDAALIARLLA
jgi:shikimate dehydrogenase